MLIHLVPRLYNRSADVHLELLDVTVPELGLVLKGGKDIVARRPYPSKCLLVACRKIGQKAMTGLLIDTANHLVNYTCITRWAMNAEVVIKHEVNHVVLDSSFGAVTDEMVLWYGYRGFENRWPIGLYQNSAPVHVQPRMDIVDPRQPVDLARTGAESHDEMDCSGIITHRWERFQQPTIEPARLSAGKSSFAERVPPFEHAFRP